MHDFQPRHGEDAYPIGRLVLGRAAELGLSRSELVVRLGYRNISRGHRSLANTLLTGRSGPFLLANLAAALEVEQSIVDEALAATSRQHAPEALVKRRADERAYYAAFRQHLRYETERSIPQPKFVAGLVALQRLRIVNVDHRVWYKGPEHRDRLELTAVQGHYREQEGCIPGFGRITSYALVLAPGVFCDLAISYDIRGRRSGPMRSVPRVAN
jgi:hypothetical protein